MVVDERLQTRRGTVSDDIQLLTHTLGIGQIGFVHQQLSNEHNHGLRIGLPGVCVCIAICNACVITWALVSIRSMAWDLGQYQVDGWIDR